MEQLDYNLLYRWLVGLGIDDAVCDAGGPNGGELSKRSPTRSGTLYDRVRVRDWTYRRRLAVVRLVEIFELPHDAADSG